MLDEDRKIKALQNEIVELKGKVQRFRSLYEIHRDRYHQMYTAGYLYGKNIFQEVAAQQYAIATANGIVTSLEYDYDGIKILKVKFPEFVATVSLGAIK